MNLAEAIHMGSGKLSNAEVPEPIRETKLLLAYSVGRDEVFLIAHPEYEMTRAEFAKFEGAILRRAAREPYQYIVGKQEFYGLDFIVTPAVLIPRPETEMLVERSIELLTKIRSPRLLDIGTGSGCISISILAKVPDATGLAVDISNEALKVASLNADKHNVADRLELKMADVFAELNDESFDLIVSNPPYVKSEDIPGLQPEVREHEPAGALTDGGSGLSIISRIISGATTRLVPGGMLLIEIGIGQDQEVIKLVTGKEWKDGIVVRDFQSIPRMLQVRRR